MTGESEPLAPIVVDGTGRDGTTLIMQLLGTAPEIAFDRSYPYEWRYLSYLLHWSRLPTREDWDEEHWNQDNLSHAGALGAEGLAGPLPWVERSLIDGDGEADFSREMFDAAWEAFSARARAAVRKRLGDPGLAVRYYAQKSAESWELPLGELPGARLICLLRDPRDVWLSSVAFHRRRVAVGETFLPIGLEDPVEGALDKFISDQLSRLRWLPQAEAEHGASLVRYESLVGDLEVEAERLGEWLGVRLDAAAVQRRRGEFADHITAGGAEQSVGRWRREMSPELAARFWRAMGAELSELGYEP